METMQPPPIPKDPNQVLAEATRLFLDDFGYGNFGNVYIQTQNVPEPQLVISLKHRHVAYGAAEKGQLELADPPYLNGMEILKAFGAKQADIDGGFSRDDNGRAALEEGTFGKEGPGSQRMYTQVRFTVPVSKLDRSIAELVVNTRRAAKEITREADEIFAKPFGKREGHPLAGNGYNLAINLGSDFSEATGKLELLRESLDAAIVASGTDFKTDDILPRVPDRQEKIGGVFGVVFNLGTLPDAAPVLKDMLARVKFAQKGHAKWMQEEKIRATGVDTSIDRLPLIIEKLGFPGASVKRRPTEMKIELSFPAPLSADGVKQLHGALTDMAKGTNKGNDLFVLDGEGKKQLRGTFLGHTTNDVPPEGVKRMVLDFVNMPNHANREYTQIVMPLQAEALQKTIENGYDVVVMEGKPRPTHTK